MEFSHDTSKHMSTRQKTCTVLLNTHMQLRSKVFSSVNYGLAKGNSKRHKKDVDFVSFD